MFSILVIRDSFYNHQVDGACTCASSHCWKLLFNRWPQCSSWSPLPVDFSKSKPLSGVVTPRYPVNCFGSTYEILRIFRTARSACSELTEVSPVVFILSAGEVVIDPLAPFRGGRWLFLHNWLSVTFVSLNVYWKDLVQMDAENWVSVSLGIQVLYHDLGTLYAQASGQAYQRCWTSK